MKGGMRGNLMVDSLTRILATCVVNGLKSQPVCLLKFRQKYAEWMNQPLACFCTQVSAGQPL